MSVQYDLHNVNLIKILLVTKDSKRCFSKKQSKASQNLLQQHMKFCAILLTSVLLNLLGQSTGQCTQCTRVDSSASTKLNLNFACEHNNVAR